MQDWKFNLKNAYPILQTPQPSQGACLISVSIKQKYISPAGFTHHFYLSFTKEPVPYQPQPAKIHIKSVLNPDVRFISLSRRHDHFSFLSHMWPKMSYTLHHPALENCLRHSGHYWSLLIFALQWCFCVPAMVQDSCALHYHRTKNWDNSCRRGDNS